MEKVMKVLLINGSPNKNGCTFTALSQVANTLNEEGIETQIFHIGTKPLLVVWDARNVWSMGNAYLMIK